MTIAAQIEAVNQWLNFTEAWMHERGEEPRLLDWERHLVAQAQAEALREVEQIARGLLEDDFTREAAERILAEVEGVS